MKQNLWKIAAAMVLAAGLGYLAVQRLNEGKAPPSPTVLQKDPSPKSISPSAVVPISQGAELSPQPLLASSKPVREPAFSNFNSWADRYLQANSDSARKALESE